MFESSLDKQRVLFGNNSRQVADVLDSLSQIRARAGTDGRSRDNSPPMRCDSMVERVGRGARLHAVLSHRVCVRADATWQVHAMPSGSCATRSIRSAKTRPADHQYVCSAEHLLGEVLLETNRLTDAEAMLTAAMNRWKRTDAPAWRSARSASALGEVLFKQGRMREAETYLTRATPSSRPTTAPIATCASRRASASSSFYVSTGQREKLNELMLATSGASPSNRQIRQN